MTKKKLFLRIVGVSLIAPMPVFSAVAFVMIHGLLPALILLVFGVAMGFGIYCLYWSDC